MSPVEKDKFIVYHMSYSHRKSLAMTNNLYGSHQLSGGSYLTSL